MTTIYLAHEVPALTVRGVQQLARDTTLHDAEWNGASIRVMRDDFTWLDSAGDTARNAQLLQKVLHVVRAAADLQIDEAPGD